MRPEAGEFLSHIIGSGHDASQIVTTFLRVVKKVSRIIGQNFAIDRESLTLFIIPFGRLTRFDYLSAIWLA